MITIPEISDKKLPYCYTNKKRSEVICETQECYIRRQCGFCEKHNVKAYYDSGSNEIDHNGDDNDMSHVW